MDSFTRCCWYWDYWNNLIESQLELLDDNKWIRVNIDQIADEIEKVKKFVGYSDFDFKILHLNKVHKKHKNNYKLNNQFSEDQINTLNKYVKSSYSKWFK
jgi:predicted patatin/cPLA2 family phospholipase